MRVMHIASGDIWGGAEVQLITLLSGLTEVKQVDPLVVVLNEGMLLRQLKKNGFNHRLIDEHRFSFPRLLRDLRKLRRGFAPNIIHSHGYKETILACCAAVSHRNHPGLVRTYHGDDEFNIPPFALTKRATRFLERFLTTTMIQRIVSVSPELATRLEERYAGTRIITIQNGIDERALLGQSVYPETLTSHRIKVGLVGRLAPIKRVDIFLEIARLISSRSPRRFSFFIIGSGPLQEEIESRIRELDLQSDVSLLGFQSPVAPLLRQLDFLTITSDHEGLPTVLLEALLFGLPIVAHAVGGIPTVLGGGKYGTLIAKQSPHSYVDALLEQADDFESAREKAARGRDFVRMHYTSARVARDHLALYSSIAALTQHAPEVLS